MHKCGKVKFSGRLTTIDTINLKKVTSAKSTVYIRPDMSCWLQEWQEKQLQLWFISAKIALLLTNTWFFDYGKHVAQFITVLVTAESNINVQMPRLVKSMLCPQWFYNPGLRAKLRVDKYQWGPVLTSTRCEGTRQER